MNNTIKLIAPDPNKRRMGVKLKSHQLFEKVVAAGLNDGSVVVGFDWSGMEHYETLEEVLDSQGVSEESIIWKGGGIISCGEIGGKSHSIGAGIPEEVAREIEKLLPEKFPDIFEPR